MFELIFHFIFRKSGRPPTPQRPKLCISYRSIQSHFYAFFKLSWGIQSRFDLTPRGQEDTLSSTDRLEVRWAGLVTVPCINNFLCPFQSPKEEEEFFGREISWEDIYDRRKRRHRERNPPVQKYFCVFSLFIGAKRWRLMIDRGKKAKKLLIRRKKPWPLWITLYVSLSICAVYLHTPCTYSRRLGQL